MNVCDARSSSVLLVEGSDADSACIARALTFQGEPHPFVAQIVSRKEVLRRLARSTFDVALVDLSPFDEAIITLRDIRRAAPDMPIVALTCHVDEHQALEVLKLGVQDHLFKTEVSAKLLVRSLRFAVERNRADTLESLNRKLVAAERSLQQAKEQLETKNRRLAELYRTAHEFVDNVSHEFRTPLTVIKEYVSLIEDGVVGDITGEQRRMLAIVEDRADDLNTMVDDMLDVSRLEAGMLGVWRKSCRLGDIIDHVWPNLEKKAAVKGVEMISNVASCDRDIFCDSEKIGRVLINLTVNAIKFSGPHGRVEVWGKQDPTAREVTIGITDSGPGIDDDCLAVIFDRFKQVNDHCRCAGKGFGLGLNIAKELVDLNFGHMNVQSKVGAGSTFSFTVPLAEPLEVADRYLAWLEKTRSGESSVSVLVAEVEQCCDESMVEEIDSFLNYVSRRGDLILQMDCRRWLFFVPISGLDLERFCARLAEARLEANRNRPRGPLADIRIHVDGTWSVANHRDIVLRRMGHLLHPLELSCA